MRRHNDGGQFTALARGSARAGTRETRRLRNSLDGGGRHDVCTHHRVRQLIPQRGPTIRPGPSSHPHRPGSPSTPSPASRRPNHFRLDTVRDAGPVWVVCRVRGRPELAVMLSVIAFTGDATARPQLRAWPAWIGAIQVCPSGPVGSVPWRPRRAAAVACPPARQPELRRPRRGEFHSGSRLGCSYRTGRRKQSTRPAAAHGLLPWWRDRTRRGLDHPGCGVRTPLLGDLIYSA